MPDQLINLHEAKRRIVAVRASNAPTGAKDFAVNLMFGSLAGHVVKKLVRSYDDIAGVCYAELEQLSGLCFPPGHPRLGTVYASNPRRPDNYVPLTELHRTTLREKAAELFGLLASLRAQEVAITVHHGHESTTQVGIGALIPAKVPVKVRTKTGLSSRCHIRRRVCCQVRRLRCT